MDTFLLILTKMAPEFVPQYRTAGIYSFVVVFKKFVIDYSRTVNCTTGLVKYLLYCSALHFENILNL